MKKTFFDLMSTPYNIPIMYFYRLVTTLTKIKLYDPKDWSYFSYPSEFCPFLNWPLMSCKYVGFFKLKKRLNIKFIILIVATIIFIIPRCELMRAWTRADAFELGLLNGISITYQHNINLF